MASRFPDSITTTSSDAFSRAELSINCTFNSLIQTLAERRDQLQLQLHVMKLSYKNKEETRLKHIQDLDQLISHLEEATIQQNRIVKLQEEQIQKLKTEKLEFLQSNAHPFPQFLTTNLAELVQQMETLGTLQDVNTLYSTKMRPFRSLGKKGKGRSELNGPYGVVTDGQGAVFVVETGNRRIQVVSLEGRFISELGRGELILPHSIALYKEFVFVSDKYLNVVMKFKIQNSHLVCKSKLELSIPSGLTVDDGEVFVADCGKNRVAVLSLDLKFIREFRNRKLRNPVDVKVNMDKVFVADHGKPHNVHVFSKQGDLMDSLISLRDGSGSIFLCFDKFDHILISDYSGKVIQIFNSEGHLIHSIECDYEPTGIAVTSDSVVVCADLYNNKINMF